VAAGRAVRGLGFCLASKTIISSRKSNRSQQLPYRARKAITVIVEVANAGGAHSCVNS
jgi:hypothetical protein